MPTLAEVLREQRRRLDAREDDAVRRVASVYDMLESDIERRLHHVNWLIDEARRTGGPIPASWLHTQSRYQILLQEVRTIDDLYTTQANRVLRDARMMEIRAGALDAMERTGVMGPVHGHTTVNYQAVESMAAQLSSDSPVTRVLQGFGDERAQAIERRLLSGIANGDGVDAIVRDIMRDVGDVASPWRIRTIVRTEGVRSYRESQLDQYQNIPEVAGFVWQAHFGPRTCIACLSMDGTVFATREDVPQGHVNCRCTIVPEPENMYPSVRRYLNQRGSGEEWLRRQSPEAIRQHFPSERAYQAFMRGDVTLKDFTGLSHSKTWGTSVTQLSATQVLGAA